MEITRILFGATKAFTFHPIEISHIRVMYIIEWRQSVCVCIIEATKGVGFVHMRNGTLPTVPQIYEI